MADRNFENRTLFQGDNLEFLRGMNTATIDLIATDPPFNKGKDFHATPDSLAKGAKFVDRWLWEKDVHEEWVDAIKDNWRPVYEVIDAAKVASGMDMAAFLCWLGVRLIEMHRVLKPTGSIYLHIDHTAHAWTKALMDAVFGRKNFRNEIVWSYSGWNKRLRAHMERRHDIVLFYSMSDKSTFHYPTRPWEGKEEYVRVRKQKVRIDDKGREYVLSDAGGGKRVSRYLDEAMKYGVPLDDVWHVDKLNNSDKVERTGYPTQKPLALYERIIKASSNKGDMVLDPFAGCATTPVAAERLGRHWVGMDIWEGARGVVLGRLEKETKKSMAWDAVITHSFTPPLRTDANEIPVPDLRLEIQRPAEPWQKLTHKQMVKVLANAQEWDGKVACAGCGRVLELAFMELDHITPKSDRGENHILNRILLCRPCNGTKRDNLTLAGLLRQNKRKDVGWMENEEMARVARVKAERTAKWVRDQFGTLECQALIQGF